MKTIEQLNAEHAAALEKLVKEQAIAVLCPLPPEHVIMTNGLGPWAMYKAASLVDAIAIMERFETVPFWGYRGNFTRLQPESFADEKSGEQVHGPWAASIDVNQGPGFGPDARLSFFFKAGERICRARIWIEGVRHMWGATTVQEEAGYGRPRRKRIIDWRANTSLSAMTDKYIKWGSGSDDAANFEYLLSADYEDGGEDHAKGQLWCLAEEPRRNTFAANPIAESFLSTMLEDLQMSENEECPEPRDCGTIWTCPESTFQHVLSIAQSFRRRVFPTGDDQRGLDLSQIGSDLYLEMAGHGAGFSDRTWSTDPDESREIAETLTAAVNREKTIETYIGDDGRAYITGVN